MSNIKPIETIYNGYRFRSRLEARWAVLFDALGVEMEKHHRCQSQYLTIQNITTK